MAFGGLPNLLATRSLQNFVSETRLRLDDVRSEAVTGRVADLREALSGDVGRVQRIEKLVADEQRYGDALSLAATRYETVQTVLDDFRADSSRFVTSAQAAINRGDPVTLGAAAQDARTRLDAALAQLNTSLAGRALFSGAAIDTQPFGSADTLLTAISAIITPAADAATAETALDTYFGAGGGFETTFYQGDDTLPEPSIEVAQGRRFAPGVTAIDQEIKDMIRGIAVVALTADTATTDAKSLGLAEAAIIKIREGEETLIATQARIGGEQQEIERLTARNAFTQNALETTLNALIARDQFEAAAEMTALETQLEATYLTTARIANLNLTSFLR